MHRATEACDGDHCFSCNEDEPLNGRVPYRLCYECGHAYWTARDLRREFRRVMREVAQFAPPLERRFLRLRWGATARRIYSCPKCTHDF